VKLTSHLQLLLRLRIPPSLPQCGATTVPLLLATVLVTCRLQAGSRSKYFMCFPQSDPVQKPVLSCVHLADRFLSSGSLCPSSHQLVTAVLHTVPSLYSSCRVSCHLRFLSNHSYTIAKRRRVGSGGIAPLFFTSVLDGGEWSASRPSQFTPGGRNHRHPLGRGLGGPQSQIGHCGEEKILFPLSGNEPRTFVPLYL
jgi:hypothetical protein